MDAAGFIALPTHTFLGLANFLRDSGSELSPAEAATQAIDQWLAANAGTKRTASHDSMPGYQWKCLFLPDGTELRMQHNGQTYCARVVGNDIDYHGQRVSPRQFTLAIAGDGRNAWREILIRMPGEKNWKRASVRRAEIERKGAPPALTSTETMKAAAASMSEALKAALALVEHAAGQQLRQHDQRAKRPRRTEDVLADYCQLD